MSDTPAAAPSAAPQTASSASSESSAKLSISQADPKAEASGKDSSPKAPASSAPKDETSTQAAKRLFKVKIDGQESEVDEDELLRGYQLRQASDKRFKEAMEKQKTVEEILDILKKDPRKALTHPEIGVDVRNFAESVLAEALEEELMDPKEKELRELRKKLDAREKEAKDREENERKTKEEAHIQELTANYAKEIEGAIKDGGLPYNAPMVNRVKDYMLAAIENGYELSAKDVIPYVKKDFTADIKAMFGASDASIIADLLGEDGIKRVKEWDTKRIKDPLKGKEVSAKEQPKAKDAPKKLFVTTDEYFADLKKRFGE